MKARTVTQRMRMDTKYMKRAISAILTFFLLLSPMCGDEDPHNDGEHTDTDSLLFTPGGRRRTVPLFNEGMLDTIADLQEAVSDSPKNTGSLEQLQRYCLDTVTGSFLVVGKGTANPEHPPSAIEQGRRRAAIYAGQQWALYLKAHHIGRRIPYGEEIRGKVMYSKVLMEKTESETLSVLLQVPVGSVVLEESTTYQTSPDQPGKPEN